MYIYIYIHRTARRGVGPGEGCCARALVYGGDEYMYTLYMHMTIYVHLYIYIYMHLHLCICLYIYMYTYEAWRGISLGKGRCARALVFRGEESYTYKSIDLSLNLSIYLSSCLSIY